ncbi:hypothetical protein [Nocardioides flavescens]|uniref:Uncharacterized protein n=1 Tax=Nocardioides flavescens TaxID=2691959 RepID=A0A6L7F1Y3_9ACTN|nr:hypothetical protein [Nocardioides flavescens]MXG91555.1 hypothetical protein [Nocardioides flavescens]
MTAYDSTENYGGQMGVKFQDGQQVESFYFDETAQQQSLDASATVDGRVISALFPTDVLGELGKRGVSSWSAALSLNGQDVGLCPRAYGYLPFPGATN